MAAPRLKMGASRQLLISTDCSNDSQQPSPTGQRSPLRHHTDFDTGKEQHTAMQGGDQRNLDEKVARLIAQKMAEMVSSTSWCDHRSVLTTPIASGRILTRIRWIISNHIPTLRLETPHVRDGVDIAVTPVRRAMSTQGSQTTNKHHSSSSGSTSQSSSIGIHSDTNRHRDKYAVTCSKESKKWRRKKDNKVQITSWIGGLSRANLTLSNLSKSSWRAWNGKLVSRGYQCHSQERWRRKHSHEGMQTEAVVWLEWGQRSLPSQQPQALPESRSQVDVSTQMAQSSSFVAGNISNYPTGW